MARVIFFQRIWYEFNGLMIISSVLKEHGHYVDLFIGNDASFILNRIKPNDIVSFSIMSGEYHWAIKQASYIKKRRNVLIVFGGPHPTYFPEIIEHPAVDIVCCGEGEYAMLDLANAHDKGMDYGKIPNLLVKYPHTIKRNEVRFLISDLDRLPFPDHGIYYKYRILRKNPVKPFMASRGCPFSCSYCCNQTLKTIYSCKGKFVRFRSPVNLISEIEKVESQYGLKAVYFADDLFVLNQIWLEEFTSLYIKRIKKPYICFAHANTLSEEKVIMLKESGCRTVAFAIETGNEKIRFELLNKYITNRQIEKVGRLLKRYKLRFTTFNMVGFPGENVSNVLETIKLNIKIGTDYPRCSILTPYPGTKIAESQRNKIKIGGIYNALPHTEVSFEVQRPREILNLHYFFQTAVIFPSLLPLIKRLIRFPPNIIFRFWWSLVYFFVFLMSTTRSPIYTLVFAVKTFRIGFGKVIKKEYEI